MIGGACALIMVRYLFLHTIGEIEEDTWFQTTLTLYTYLPAAIVCGAYLWMHVGIEKTRNAWDQGKGHDCTADCGFRRAWFDLWRHYRHYRGRSHWFDRGSCV